ncbi:MAG: BrnT family toxin [Gemmatimonadetes bacterium]|nr:BrnT family toxin [Gemmatimonadota bacterium]
MDIGFVWDENKYREVQEKHEVQFYEAVAAFDDPNGFEVSDLSGYEDRSRWIGATAAGRVLVVVYSDEDVPLLRLITAFDATGGLRDEYYRRRGI